MVQWPIFFDRITPCTYTSIFCGTRTIAFVREGSLWRYLCQIRLGIHVVVLGKHALKDEVSEFIRLILMWSLSVWRRTRPDLCLARAHKLHELRRWSRLWPRMPFHLDRGGARMPASRWDDFNGQMCGSDPNRGLCHSYKSALAPLVNRDGCCGIYSICQVARERRRAHGGHKRYRLSFSIIMAGSFSPGACQ